MIIIIRIYVPLIYKYFAYILYFAIQLDVLYEMNVKFRQSWIANELFYNEIDPWFISVTIF